MKCLNKAEIFLNFFVSHPISDQKLAKSKLFIARKECCYGYCVATAIGYTRSMFISLLVSSDVISGYFFPENVYF